MSGWADEGVEEGWRAGKQVGGRGTAAEVAAQVDMATHHSCERYCCERGNDVRADGAGSWSCKKGTGGQAEELMKGLGSWASGGGKLASKQAGRGGGGKGQAAGSGENVDEGSVQVGG